MPEYDVFISHASEDKDFAEPLYEALTEQGLRVWYDRSEIQLGDSLRRSIDEGLRNCKFGVVILSPTFSRKNWTQYELDGLVTRQMTGERIILPIWHRVTADGMEDFPEALRDIVSLNSATMTLARITDEIVNRVGVTPQWTRQAPPRESSFSFGVFYVATENTPRRNPNESHSSPFFYGGFGLQPGQWISATAQDEELEHRIDGDTLRVRLDYGNNFSGDEIQASQLIFSGESFALTIVTEHGETLYFPSVRNSTGRSPYGFGQQSRSGWIVLKIDSQHPPR